jgi:arginyl-tRNA synthetase
MFQEYEERVAGLINNVLEELGYERQQLQLRPIPFAGSWGTSLASFPLASRIVAQEQGDELEGLSKKEAKQRQQALVREKSIELADRIAERLTSGEIGKNGTAAIARVESVNGYVNLYFDTDTVANEVVRTAIGQGADYGRGPKRADRVMVEFSQPNTHKAFHVGHLRNAGLGNATANITEFAGYETIRANYWGDIGMHVIQTLWCYLNFHKEQRIPRKRRGRKLGDFYTEAVMRLNYRNDVLDLLHELSDDDAMFVEKIDGIMRELYRKDGVPGEDIAYLVGQIANQRKIDVDKLFEQESITKLLKYVGPQLKEELAYVKEHGPQEAPPPTSRTANVRYPPPVVTVENTTERIARWKRLNATPEWWPHVPEWQQEIKDLFQVWERKEEWFVDLWRETRQWSIDEFHRIYEELGIRFDVEFSESEVEEQGRRIVYDLVERGIAEMSDGMPVVNIDKQLGLEQDRYRTLPLLRSDGTTLYSTKDLELTRRKFEDYEIDRSVWVIDNRQGFYMQQIFKIMELWGFEQADKCYHLGYEFVTLPEGIISSRRGITVLYEDAMTAMRRRAKEIIEEKNPDGRLGEEQKDEIARQVAVGSILYLMLSRDNNTLIEFNMEEALSFQGHAAPYIQYAHARACRILERAGEIPEGRVEFVDLQNEEIDLIQKLAEFPAEVEQAASEYRPLVIADYVYELARLFNDFYADFEARPIVSAPEPARTMRLALVAATRQTLANGLRLLGVPATEVM